jgi:RNase H-fold protein (predicted Holliday junction resolvase)
MKSEPEPIRENNQAPDAGGESDVQASNTKPNVPPTPSLPTLPPTKPHREITCKTEKDWWDKWKPFVEMAGIVILSLYTGYTIKMYYANKEAADAAKLAADTTYAQLFLNKRASDVTLGQMQAQTVAQGNAAAAEQRAATTAEHTLGLMQLQQRALVVLEIPPKFDKPDNSVTYAAKNFGKSVASRVRVGTVFVDEMGEAPQAQEKACSEIGTAPTGGFANWELLVPEQVGYHRKAFLRSIPSGRELSYFVGCIRYADPFSENRWTRFCYQPSFREPGILVVCFGYNSTDEDEESKPKNERQKASK